MRPVFGLDLLWAAVSDTELGVGYDWAYIHQDFTGNFVVD